MEDEHENIAGQEERLLALEAEIVKLLSSVQGSAYNAVDSWALIVRATSNDGSGDRHYGGIFMPPEQDSFQTAGLRWLFDEGFKSRYG